MRATGSSRLPASRASGSSPALKLCAPARSGCAVAANSMRVWRFRRRAQFLGRQEHLGGLQQRPRDVRAQAAVAAVDRLPDVVDPGACGILDAEQALSGEVIEQRGALLEEQRQEVLDAARRDAARDVLVVGAGAVVVVETLVPAAAEGRDRLLVERVLAPGQQAQALERRERALGLGIEAAQRLDLVVEQLDAHRRVVPHREQVHDRAAHRELAVLVDVVDGAVAGACQGVAQRDDAQALAGIERQRRGAHVGDRRGALHQRCHRHDQHHRVALRQARQRQQAVRDQVLVRREAVVGQRFPVGQPQHGPGGGARSGEEEPQVRLDALGRGAAGGQDDHGAGVLARHARQRQRVGAGNQSAPSQVVAGTRPRGRQQGCVHAGARPGKQGTRTALLRRPRRVPIIRRRRGELEGSGPRRNPSQCIIRGP